MQKAEKISTRMSSTFALVRLTIWAKTLKVRASCFSNYFEITSRSLIKSRFWGFAFLLPR